MVDNNLENNHNHHHHHHGHNKNLKSLLCVLSVTFLYMLTEFIGGYYTNSLALMADAGHMLGDCASLFLSFMAIWFAFQHAPKEKSFGYFRGETIAAFINGITLIIIAVMIMIEAYHRFLNVQNVSSFGMLIISFGGLIVNIIGTKILQSGSRENLNVKGAYFHIIGDLLGSIGAIIAGLLMYFFGWYLADPIISFVISLLVLYSSFGIIKSAFDILMESVPDDININCVQKTLEEINDVVSVHDLHIWSISSDAISLSVHIVIDDCTKYEGILTNAVCVLKDKYGISHATIQIEPKDFCKDFCVFN